MRTEISFLKVSGAGNDFLLVDNLQGSWSLDWPSFAAAVCSRHFGVGADGLLVLDPADEAAFRMLYFNADGSFGGMCGNGGRCAARYAVERGVADPRHRFEACGQVYEAEVEGALVSLHLPDVRTLPREQHFSTEEDGILSGWTIDTGSPHVVFRTEDPEIVDVTRRGRAIRHDPCAGPLGANVNFYSVNGDYLVLRTYERGVEAETQACGTGAVATALVSSVLDGSASPVRLKVRSGEELIVTFRRTKDGFTGLILKGSAHFVFTGTVVYDSEGAKLLQAELHVSGQHL